MNIKNKFFLIGIAISILVFTLFQINFLNSQELTEIIEISSADFTYHATGYEISQNGEIIFNSEDSKLIINQGQENEIIIEGSSGIKISPLGKISVTESGSAFLLNGNEFKNIESGSIELDQKTGKITKADFYTNKNLGNYNINGNEFNVPANQRFVYNSKEEKFYLQDGAEILTAKDIKIESDGILNYKNNKVSGVLNFDEEGNVFVKLREEVKINGVLIKNSVPKSYAGTGKGDELGVFFDKNNPGLKKYGEYLILDAENNYIEYANQKVGARTSGKQVSVNFIEDNSFYGDILTEKDYLGFAASERASGSIKITRSGLESLPVLEVKNVQDINLLQDATTLSFSDEISISQNNLKKLGTVPMRIEFKEKQVVGLIPDDKWTEELGLKEEAGRYFLWSGKEELVKSSFGGTGVGGIAELGEAEKKELEKWIDGAELKIDNSKNLWAMTNDPGFAKALKGSRDATSFLENMYNNKEIGLSEVMEKTTRSQNIGAIQNLQNDLEAEKITQNDFYNQIDILNKQKVDTDVSFNELDKMIGTKNTQNLKNNIEKKMESYFSYFQNTGDQKYLLRVAGQNEINSINNCVGRGNSFGDCFNQNYNFYGAKTDLCIKSRKYCPVLEAGELFRIKF